MYKNILFSKAKEGLNKSKIQTAMKNIPKISDKTNYNSVCTHNSGTIKKMIEEYEKNLIGKFEK